MMQTRGIALAPAPCIDVVERNGHARRRDGDQKEVRGQVRKSDVRPRSEQERRDGDASPQEGHAQARAWRQGREGEEPQAGDRDRPLRGAEEGREGSAQELIPKELIPKEQLEEEQLEEEQRTQGWLEKEFEKEFEKAFVVEPVPAR